MIQVVTLEEQDPSSPDAEAFYHQLGHSGNGTIAIKSSAKSAVNPAGSTITSPRLFKVGPASGKLSVLVSQPADIHPSGCLQSRSTEMVESYAAQNSPLQQLQMYSIVHMAFEARYVFL